MTENIVLNEKISQKHRDSQKYLSCRPSVASGDILTTEAKSLP